METLKCPNPTPATLVSTETSISPWNKPWVFPLWDKVHWLPRPWYHDEDQPGNSNQFSLCHNLCPYCNNPDHSPPQCPAPHHLCNDRLSCIIPSYHKNFGAGCPADACRHLIDMLLDDYHTGLMEDINPNPGSDNGEA